jgi:hypothetical protein
MRPFLGSPLHPSIGTSATAPDLKSAESCAELSPISIDGKKS